MAGGQQITYTVLARDSKGWQPQGTTNEMQVAVGSAQALVQNKKFLQARVDQTYYDKRNKREVTSTILQRGKKTRNVPIAVWFAVAVLAGAISFAVTYTVVNGDGESDRNSFRACKARDGAWEVN